MINNEAMLRACEPRLIVVDDEPLLVELITNMLTRCAYEIRPAYDGDEALSIAKEFRPDCVVTGIIMPRMDGLRAAVAILQILPSCKFIFMSGSSDRPAIRDEYTRLGWDFRLLLPKPFQRPDLLGALALVGFPCAAAQ